MPSPIGHVLAGAAAAWTADLIPGDRTGRTASPGASWYQRAGGGLTLACCTLAAAPDLDLLVGAHRSFTHSVTAGVIAGLVGAIVASRMGRPVARVALMCAAAWGTHLLLDWLSADTFYPYGIQLFWPFSHAWFISGLNVFAQTERRHPFSAATMRLNAATAVREIVILLPIVVAIWLVRVKALAGLAAELACGDHPAE
jgi:membrane-bound metal-dependent hydrolase YbcI (DUF457 family)